MAIWHLGEGRHKEKFRAAAPVKGGAGDQVSWTLPLSQRIHEKSVQGQAQPPGSGWILSLLFGQTEMGEGVEATPPNRRSECNRTAQ